MMMYNLSLIMYSSLISSKHTKEEIIKQMAKTHRKYSSKRHRDDVHLEKLEEAINAESELEEKFTGYTISGKKRWNRHHSPDFDYGDR